MERESNQSPAVGRKRYLNIVYFVESARSHTIRLNLRYARWVIGFAAIVCAWAIGSIFWILSLNMQVSETRERLETSLTTIFDYQIKNDKVFETAYPADATNSYYSESAHLASNNPLRESDQPKQEAPKPSEKPVTTQTDNRNLNPPESPATATQEKSTNQPSAVTANAELNKATANSSQQNQAPVQKFINITAAKISKVGHKISLVFDINNLQHEKAEGYIWAIATFKGQDGEPKHIGAPNTAKIDPATGQIKSAKSAYRFSIQRFKKKDFEFKAPSGKDWKLTKLTIHFTDLEQTNEDLINIPVDQLALREGVDQPITDIKL